MINVICEVNAYNNTIDRDDPSNVFLVVSNSPNFNCVRVGIRKYNQDLQAFHTETLFDGDGASIVMAIRNALNHK